MFPDSKPAKLAKVKAVLDEQARLVADSSPDILPALLITRLQTAYAAAAGSFDTQRDENTESGGVYADLKQQKADDTPRLQTLYQWAVVHFTDDGAQLPFLGFRRSSDMGQPGGGHAPATPQNIAYNVGDQAVTWDDVASETSFEIEITVGGVVTEHSVGANVTTFALAQGAASQSVRVRAWNTHGVSGWSVSLEVPAESLAAVNNFAYSPVTNFSWEPTVEDIRLEASYDGGATWNEIAVGQYPTGNYPWSPPAGLFRIRRESGGLSGPWSQISAP